jgi:hypothetical protein
MPAFVTNDVLVQFLVWACSALGAALIGTVVYLALGVNRKLDLSREKAEEQFAQFGRQLTSVKELLVDDIHKHDVRITRLEEWRKASDGHD